MRPRQGRAPSQGPGLTRAGRAGNPALQAYLPACCPPTASLVLLNQQSQDFGLGQGHVGIHAEVVGAATVLPAEVPAGGEMQGQWGQGSVPASPPRITELPCPCTFYPCPHWDHQVPAKGPWRGRASRGTGGTCSLKGPSRFQDPNPDADPKLSR